VDGKRRRLDDVLGLGFAVICRGAPDDATRALAGDLGATLLRIGPRSVLGRWLRGGHARVALIRPDRVVLAAARSGAGLVAGAAPVVRATSGAAQD
jgi:3-(3-hydroxy-phenyl)propionate hydroxylase